LSEQSQTSCDATNAGFSVGPGGTGRNQENISCMDGTFQLRGEAPAFEPPAPHHYSHVSTDKEVSSDVFTYPPACLFNMCPLSSLHHSPHGFPWYVQSHNTTSPLPVCYPWCFSYHPSSTHVPIYYHPPPTSNIQHKTSLTSNDSIHSNSTSRTANTKSSVQHRDPDIPVESVSFGDFPPSPLHAPIKTCAVAGSHTPRNIINGDIELVGDDGCRRVDASGCILGPDGDQLIRGNALSDWELLDKRRASLITPIDTLPFTPFASTAHGRPAVMHEPLSGDNDDSGVCSSGDNDESGVCSSLRCSNDVEELLSGDNDESGVCSSGDNDESGVCSSLRCSNDVEELLSGDNDESGVCSSGDNDESGVCSSLRCSNDVEDATNIPKKKSSFRRTRRQHSKALTAYRQAQAESHLYRQMVALERAKRMDPARCEDATCAINMGNVPIPEPRVNVMKLKARQHSNYCSDVKVSEAKDPAVSHGVVRLMMLDTGATDTFLTVQTGKSWDGDRFESVRVHDVQGNIIEARGGGSLHALLRDRDGVTHLELLAQQAYESSNFDLDLLSFESLEKLGWDFHIISGKGATLVSPSPHRYQYPLIKKNGHYYLPTVISSAPNTGNAAVATIHPTKSRPRRNQDKVVTINHEPISDATRDKMIAASEMVCTGTDTLGTTFDAHVQTSDSNSAVAGKDKDNVSDDMSVGGVVLTNTAKIGSQLDLSVTSGIAGTDLVSDDVSVNSTNEEIGSIHAQQILQYKYGNYGVAHNSFNHNSVVVDEMIRQGKLVDCIKPPDFNCPACAAVDATRAHFQHSCSRIDTVPLPYYAIEIDIWGPYDVEDSNGFRYLFGAICRASGVLFVQPMRLKSESLEAMEAFLLLVKARLPRIEVHLNISLCGVSIVYSDRGGEFTTTYGYTRSKFDELINKVGTRQLNTPDTPQSGTTKIERVWRTIVSAALKQSMVSNLLPKYFFHSLLYAADIYNLSPTKANRINPSASPLATLGEQFDMKMIVPFGCPAVHKLNGIKTSAKSELVLIMGLNPDGPGYQFLCQDGKIRASVHVTPCPTHESPPAYVARATADSGCFDFAFSNKINCIDDSAAVSQGVSDLDDSIADRLNVPQRPPVEVGALPGHGGSRAGLEPHASAVDVPPPVSSVIIYSKSEARAIESSARDAGAVFMWSNQNPRKGKAHERWSLFCKAKTFEQWDALKSQYYVSASSGTRKQIVIDDDLLYAIQRGFVKFIQPDRPENHMIDTVTSGAMDTLNIPVKAMHARLPPWDALIARDVSDDESRNVCAIKSRQQPAPRRGDDGYSDYIDAVNKEITGMISKSVYQEVLRSEVPKGIKVLNTQIVYDPKKKKARFVAMGNLQTRDQYLESQSSMCSQESIRMLVAIAAAEGIPLRTIDFSQAFLNADEQNPNQYNELPDLPPELRNGHLGSGKCKEKVAWMKKNLYGCKQAGRVWQQYLQKYLIDTLHASCCINDRCVFSWNFKGGGRVIGAVHVDDVLYTYTTVEAGVEFLRLMRLKFDITGGDEEASRFCGIQFSRNWDEQTITMHQEDFATEMMTKYGIWGDKVEETPYLVGSADLQVFEGTLHDQDQFDYMMFIGDVTWLTKTKPGIAWSVHHLASFMQNPGPDHIKAAKHLLRYIRGSLHEGITFHGNAQVLNQGYPHRHKCIAAVDADFPHNGKKGTSGVVILMNGGTIAYKVRKQTTISNNSTESETKAASLGIELIRSISDLWAELFNQQHPVIRCMIDNAGAKKQIVNGMDSKSCASYKRAQAYCEDAVDSALIWLDRVPGQVNPADIMTKKVRNIDEFIQKNATISGADPSLFMSDEVYELTSTQSK